MYNTHSHDAVTPFSAKTATIVTYIDLEEEGNPAHTNTFQVIIATDFKETYVIFIYKHLDSTSAVAGFSENTCNLFSLPLSNTTSSDDLVKRSNTGVPGKFVYRLNNNTNNVTCVVDQQHIVFKKTNIYGHNFGVLTTQWHYQLKKPLVALFTQIISGNSVSSSFLAGHYQMSSSSVSLLALYSVFSVTKTNFTLQFMGIPEGEQRTDHFQYGRINLLPFSTEVHCYNYRFALQMISVPVVKLNGEIENGGAIFYVGYVTLWLRNVSRSGFDVCYREMISFSGKRNVSIDFVAVVGPVNNFTEVGSTRFHHGMHNLHNYYVKNENERFCKNYTFQYSYSRPPYVFITPEDRNGSGGQLIAWVHSIEKTHAFICAKNSMDTKTRRIKDINVHYIIQGPVDVCNNFSCPVNLQCHTNKENQPYCGCITHCFRATGETICGTNFMTYESVCHLRKHACERNGNYSSTNVSVAYQGKCRSK